MSNYASSVLANAQSVLSTKYNEAELRRKERPVLQLALKNAPYTLPDHEQLRVSDSRTVEVKYLKKKAAGSATAKVATHTGSKGDSGTLNLAYVTYTETFYTSRKQAQNNIIALQKMFQHELEQAIDNLKDRHETYGLSYLATNRCQIASPATSGAGTWNGTNYALEIANANKDRAAQYAKTFMRGRYYRGAYDMIPDLNLFKDLEYTINQGAGNSANLSFQHNGINYAPTSETILSGYSDGAALIMPAGTFAGLNWNDPLNRQGVNEGHNNVGMLGTLADPFGSGCVFDVSMYSARGDESSNGGHVQDILDQWEVTLCVGYALPPLSTASDSAVHLIGITL